MAALLVLLLVGCERAKSSNPLSPSIAGPIAGVEIGPPKPTAPQTASQIPVDQQPITLTIENATSNGVRPVSYVFEVATDAAFTKKVFTQTGVKPGADGRTSLELPQSLTAEQSYYWRVKADDGANASDYSAPVSFSIYTPVIIQAPVLHAPADGATVSSRRPTFAVIDARRTGPAGAIQYRFEVATDPAIADKVISVLVNEASEQTSYAASQDLSYATKYFWRVKALDPGHESPYSDVRSFSTPAAPPPVTPPPVTPPPAPGPAPSPGPAPFGSLDPQTAIFLNNPPDAGFWPQTATITSVTFTASAILVDFDRRQGPGKWPESRLGTDGGVQYTLGMCFQLGGQWYCSAAIQFWDGRDLEASGYPSRIADDWYYDPVRWGPMAGHQPAPGELVAIWVGQGNLRNSGNTNRERSDFVVMPFGGQYRR